MSRRHSQNGATLIVAMIFLVLMSLFAASAFRTSTTNLRITGAMEIRQEALAVAQKAIEKTISSTLFTTSPSTVAATPVVVNVDGVGAGGVTYTATLMPTPACYRTKPIKTAALDLAKADDIACIKSTKVERGGSDFGASSDAGDSMCSNSEWNIGARVTDPSTGTVVSANQGVAVRVLSTDAANSCPS